MSSQRKAKRRKMKPFKMPPVNPATRVAEVMVTDMDGNTHNKFITIFSLEQTLTQLHRRGYRVESDGEGGILATHPMAERARVKRRAAELLVQESTPVPEQTTPVATPEPEEKMGRPMRHPYKLKGQLDDVQRKEYISLVEKLRAHGWDDAKISTEACGYINPYSMGEALKNMEESGKGGSLRALEGLHKTLARVEREVQRNASHAINPASTITSDQIVAAHIQQGSAEEAIPGTIIAAGETVSIPWLERYQTSVLCVQTAVLALIDAVAEVPAPFRGKQMTDLRDTMVDALAKHDL